jgi:hypothetical protein
MHPTRKTLAAARLLAAAILASNYAPAAHAQNFTAFGEDENICRQAGATAINGASGPEAARRYDIAHARCMAAQFRKRQIDAYRNATPPAYPTPYSVGAPDAFTHIPYATPGYGYDGFSFDR